MHHIAQDHISDHVAKYHTRFSTEVFLRRPTFFMSNKDLLSKMNPRTEWNHVGQGSSGEVYRAKWLGVDVAVKTSDEIIHEDTMLEDFAIHSNIRHPNIVNFFVASPNYIIMELMNNGTLEDAITKLKKPDVELRKKWCSQVAMALRYLHESGIVHSDLKPENIMFGGGWDAKICDVGGGYFVQDSDQYSDQDDKVYTEMYLPLTIYVDGNKSQMGKTTDLYSMCIVILCILSWDIDIYSLLGIPFLERRLTNTENSREETIRDCLNTCIPRAYDLIQSYDISNDAKSFIFKMFSDPCKSFLRDSDVLQVIEHNERECKKSGLINIGCLSSL